MTDLIDRLREIGCSGLGAFSETAHDAADEIKKLRGAYTYTNDLLRRAEGTAAAAEGMEAEWRDRAKLLEEVADAAYWLLTWEWQDLIQHDPHDKAACLTALKDRAADMMSLGQSNLLSALCDAYPE